MTKDELIKTLIDLRNAEEAAINFSQDIELEDERLRMKSNNIRTYDRVIEWLNALPAADTGVLRSALKLWGQDSQIYIAVEELAELQKELLKNANRHENNRPHILEELADVLVVIECLKMIYGFTDQEINAEMTYKINRLKGRIDKATKNTEAKHE